ncbi:NERD domain-containing protein [Methylomonas sp. SURF-1]|uniref:NERD domain-containing protein n=1 Tax=Methylomonas aurea TaxID=2952224 RepID=A0ABT1UM43_9GAMM|nr:nuclease-related domain-containing protein [Methylomonas sp. SURF-1]MCQ8183310.1 NERD domain-containing protein [Methylomonas sp. SURF-1]
MIIKEADSRQDDLDTLEILLRHPKAKSETRKLIDREIKNIRSGIKGEEEAAYEMKMRFKDSKNWFVIHDLRIEVDGLVAQIDHLIINRFLEIYVCESKRFFEGIVINEQMEFSAFYGGKPYGIPSPIEQNKKHVLILEKLFNSKAVKLPERLGLSIKPKYMANVLVSKNARILRPNKKIDEIESIVKTDQFISYIDKLIDKDNNLLTLVKVVGSDTVEKLARDIVSQHKPIKFNWPAKFGLPDIEEISKSIPVKENQVKEEPLEYKAVEKQAEESGDNQKKKLICYSCGIKIPYKVGIFCWNNKKKFGGYAYCYDCQKNVI